MTNEINKYFNSVIIHTMYKFLSISDICNCCQVNKHFNKLFSANSIWNKFIANIHKIHVIDHQYYKLRIDIIERHYTFQKLKNQIINQYNSFKSEPSDSTHFTLEFINQKTPFMSATINAKSKRLYKIINDLEYLNATLNLKKRLYNICQIQCVSFDKRIRDIPKEIIYMINLSRLLIYNDNSVTLSKELFMLPKLKQIYALNPELIILPNNIINNIPIGKIVYTITKKGYTETYL